MSKFISTLFGISSAAILFIIFAVACAVATIIETVVNTDAAWAYVYETGWFGAIMVLLGLNLIYNIYKYGLAKIKKLPAFLFHISFIFILIGAIITRYFGFEGMVHIREGASSNIISTRPIYIQLMSHKSDGEIVRSDLAQYISTGGNNDFKLEIMVDGKPAILTYKDFIINGALKWVEEDGGKPRVEFVFSDEKNRRNIELQEGQVIEIGPIDFTFNAEPIRNKFIHIKLKDDKFYINTNEEISYMQMSDMSKGNIPMNQDVPMDGLKIYSLKGLNFAPEYLLKSAVQKIIPIPERSQGNNAIIGSLSYNGQSKDVYMLFNEQPSNFNVGGHGFSVAWAPRLITMPFSLYLNKFNLERYPGSNSPSGYSSDIIVKDHNTSFDYKIYMNHVLDYAGYRFFQSSYDRDEKGTILSVNKDPGKFPTYLGYFLLSLGMLFNFFNKNSRFIKLSKLIDESSKRDRYNKSKIANDAKAVLTSCVICLSLFSTNSIANEIELPYIDVNHTKNLESLIVQGPDGRMEPFDTISRDIMNKIYRAEDYHGLNHNAVMLSMMINPEYWRNADVIRVGDKKLREMLGIPQTQTHAKFGDFYAKDDQNKTYYKLGKLAEEINRKPPGNRTVLDKEILKVDERLNIFYMVYMGDILKIVPKENSENNEWFSPVQSMMYFSKDEAIRASKVLENYFANALEAQKSKNWDAANKGLDELKAYQIKYGGNIIPSEGRIKFEILFNKAKIFERLTPVYLLAGFALLIFVFIRMMKPNLHIGLAFKATYSVNILAFIIHTVGLGIRWYVSGHAPWSNAYESMVYIAWALGLSGIIFSKTSAISLALTSILAGITLFVAHLSIMDPQITNIQPVLKSYWLTIHVSVITASYGFLGLCALLGMFSLILFIFQKDKSNDEFSRNITEATRINEMSMILGLCLLTIGNFLGGVWANESWGRYWGWDPKETWSLITILIYAAVVHFRFIPKLNNQYAFAVASMFAYSSVIMTYFGVNFYLSGMHSYASGERIPVPNAVWISAVIMVVLSLLAFFKRSHGRKL